MLQAVEIANQLCGPSWLIGASDFVRREKLEEEKGGGEAEGGKDGAVAGSGAHAQHESESMFKGEHRRRDAGDKEERRAAKGGEVTGVAGGVAEGGEGGRERGEDGGAEPSEGEGGRLLALVIQLASVELQMALYDQPADTTPECEAVLPTCCQILEEASHKPQSYRLPLPPSLIPLPCPYHFFSYPCHAPTPNPSPIPTPHPARIELRPLL